ncbi:MAG TPA: ABC transporter ATP-binding protein [Actinomycetota bacterium]|jgi:ATP-binding cassette subfamily B protein|nr:ABC transporter ATP-binding protein [Actinomycetota bacterium]
MSHHRLIIPDPDAPPIQRATVRRVVRTFRPYKRRVTLVGGLILITSAIGVINPLLIKVIFDQALFCGPGCPNLGLLYWLVGIMVAIPIASGTMGIWQSYLSNVVGQRVMQDLRNALYAHLQRMPLRFFTTTRTGEIQSRLSNDVGGIQSVVTDTASSVLANTVIVISSVVAMLILSWQLTLLSLGMMPFFIWLTQRVGKARREVAANTQKSLADLSAITEETLSVSGMLLSKAFGRQRYETARFRRENERLAGLQVRQQMIGRSFFAIIQVFFSVTPALVYLVAGLVLSGGGTHITAGDIVAFTTLQSRLFFPVGSLLQITVEVQSAMALFDRVFEYLDLSPEIEDAPDAVSLPREQAKGHVRFRNVSFRYEAPREEASTGDGEAKQVSAAVHVGPDAPPGDGRRRLWTLEDVDLEIEPGALAALVGPSGAGKTTVTYLVPRFYDVQRGAVEIDGIDVRKIGLASLGHVIGMVTQETYLFHTSVRENLRYGNPEATDEELEAAARAAFIHDRIAELPDGYDTLVGERGYKLSGGEKQRLAIARVILKDPRILILDEATSSLDSTSERLVQEALRPLMRGRTSIAIAHRLSTILAADVIFVLDRGRLVEQGTHSELLERGGLYAHLYLQQFRGGTVEAETADGIVLTSGEIVPLGPQSGSS